IHRPDIIVMDEATAALDPPSQEMVMRLVLDQLPDATVISVGHRVELEAFHTRRLVLEYRKDGARLVKDEPLPGAFRRSVRWLSQFRPRQKPDHPDDGSTIAAPDGALATSRRAGSS